MNRKTEVARMDRAKQRRLQRKGWVVGDANSFLGLRPNEAALIELKLALSESVKERRQHEHVTQAELAKRLRSSQSRIAKLEAGDSSVSLDLLVRTLIALGATREDVARAIGCD
jgi:DNA-binding XRE family transcriptional regulator